MSRRYCSVCREPHQNGGLGMCNAHIEQEEIDNTAAHNAEAEQFNHFMSLSEDERWEKVFEFMRSNNWSAY